MHEINVGRKRGKLYHDTDENNTKIFWLPSRNFGANIVLPAIAHWELKNPCLYCSLQNSNPVYISSVQCLISGKLDFIFSLMYLVGSNGECGRWPPLFSETFLWEISASSRLKHKSRFQECVRVYQQIGC